MRLLAAALAALAVLAAPAGALAQGNDPFTPLPPPQQPAPAPEPAPVPGDEDDGLAVWQQVAILVSALALIGGIAYAILADARRRAPARDPATSTAGEATPSAGERARRQRRERERAKAARKQRKRNRRR